MLFRSFRAGACLSFGCGCDCQGAANLSFAGDCEHHAVVAQRYAATYLISFGAGCWCQWDCWFWSGLIFQFFAEFWYKMLLQGVGVYLPYFVIKFSRQFLKLDNRILDIPYLSARFVWRLGY